MDRVQIKKRITEIFGKIPALRDILLSSDTIDAKREAIRSHICHDHLSTFDEDRDLHPLEWVVIRSAHGAFENMLSTRNERLAGYSLLQYLNDLLHKEDIADLRAPTPGFFAELEHLMRGMSGTAQVYDDTQVTPFHEAEGREAARIRSSDLSDMAMNVQSFVNRYPWGLDPEIMEKRRENRERILNYFKGNSDDWNNWKWHVRHVVKDADTLKDLILLSPDEEEAVRHARRYGIPFGITPYYISLMDRESSPVGNDRAIRMQVIPSRYYVESIRSARESGVSMDFMLEKDTSPIEGVTRRYPMIVILKPIMTCPQICVYCQRNWQIEDACMPDAVMSKRDIDRAIRWIADTGAIREVLVTGGDPFLMSDERIEAIMSDLSRIDHIERIRIGTRMHITLPQRITDDLVSSIGRFHEPGRREIVLVTHCEHPYEITPEMMESVQKFKRTGISIYNQMVFTYYNSRKYEAAFLRDKLRMIGVTPYYSFNTKGKEETNDYRVPLARILQEQKEEVRLFPGTVRTDEVVFNVPGLGKNYLRSAQHRDIISILPDGRRVYEFHPWEKNMKLVDTYVHVDVSIYEYLERLRAEGEDMEQYGTIWYYY